MRPGRVGCPRVRAPRGVRAGREVGPGRWGRGEAARPAGAIVGPPAALRVAARGQSRVYDLEASAFSPYAFFWGLAVGASGSPGGTG